MSDLTQEQLSQITEAVRAGMPDTHECKFSSENREDLHELCRMLGNGGLDSIREMIALSKQITASKKLAWAVMITATVGGAGTIIVLGVKAWLRSIVIKP